LSCIVIGPGLVSFSGVWLFLAKQVEMGFCLLERVRIGRAVLSADRHEEIGEIEVRAIVIGGELDGARQFLESALAIADSQVALAELEMRLSESGIDLEGIGVLDRGLAVFSLSEVLLAAVKIFLLASIGIACAACENTGQQCTQNQKSNCVRALSARIC